MPTCILKLYRFGWNGAQSKERSPIPSQSWSNGFKSKESSGKRHPWAHTHKISTCHPPFNGSRHCGFKGSLNVLRRAPPRATSLTTMASSSSAWLPSQLWRRQNTTVHQAQQALIEQAMKKLCDIDMAEVNTLIRSEGKKETYVWLAPDCDALDVAKKIGIIYIESSWLILNIKILHWKKVYGFVYHHL